MTVPDPLAEVRAEFAAGLDKRIDAMQAALGRLQHEFRVEDARALYQAAHALTGTAGSMGADGLAQAAGDLEGLARGWLTRGEAVPEEWRVAAAAVGELDASAREYRATVRAGALRTPAARLAVLGELTSLINAAVDMREIFQGAILKVQRVLDFRRASVVLIDESASHYYLHTLYDKVRGGFIPGEAVFPIARGVTGEAIRSGRPIRVDALPGTEGILLQDGTRVSAMIVPLHVGERVIGALNFGHEAPGQYTDEDLDWAVVLGRQIETSLYYSKLLKTIAEQREALARQHAAVRQQRNQLEALIEASDAAIMLVGSDRRVAYANHEMARLLGIPGDAMRGTGLEIVHRFLAGALSDPSALTAQEQALSGAREMLEIALRNADRLIRLVNDLLDLSRIEARRMEFQLEPVALADAIKSSLEALAAFAADAGVTVETEPPAEALRVLGVRGRVEQVVVNLVSNAIKFSPPGGRVQVRWRRDGDGVVVEVADEGPGIPPEKLQVTFEPFRQLDSSTTRAHGGAGLGLAISHGIVQALGGKLWAESEVGAGSRFFVRLRLASN